MTTFPPLVGYITVKFGITCHGIERRGGGDPRSSSVFLLVNMLFFSEVVDVCFGGERRFFGFMT